MTRFDPRTSGIGSDRSTKWATTIVICLDRSRLSLKSNILYLKKHYFGFKFRLKIIKIVLPKSNNHFANFIK